MDDKQLVFDIFDMINTRSYDRVHDLIHPDYVDHGSPLGDVKGPDGFLALSALFDAAFTGGHNEVDMVISEGDLAAWRVTFTGTHTGELMGMPASGKEVRFQGFNFGRIKDGKAIEHWAIIDVAAMMAQIAPHG